jgi:hypothetical protein
MSSGPPPAKKKKGKKGAATKNALEAGALTQEQLLRELEELYICELNVPLKYVSPSVVNPSHPDNQSHEDRIAMEKQVKLYRENWMRDGVYNPHGQNATTGFLSLASSNLASSSASEDVLDIELKLAARVTAGTASKTVSWVTLPPAITSKFAESGTNGGLVTVRLKNGVHRMKVAAAAGLPYLPVRLYKQSALVCLSFLCMSDYLLSEILESTSALTHLTVDANQQADQRTLSLGLLAFSYLADAKIVDSKISGQLERICKVPAMRKALGNVWFLLPEFGAFS